MPTDLSNPQPTWKTRYLGYRKQISSLYLPHAQIHITFFKANKPTTCQIYIDLIDKHQKTNIYSDTIKSETLLDAQIFASEKLSEYVTTILTSLQNALAHEIMYKE